MNYFICTALGAFLICSSSAFSLLPPLYYGIAEIEAILNDKHLADHLPRGSAEMIREISKVGEHRYEIKTEKSSILAEVVHHPRQGIIGSDDLEVRFLP